ncbi:MAG: LamG-like jellyroll fold domain-containing protein, partial [Planctomycetota bacterium]
MHIKLITLISILLLLAFSACTQETPVNPPKVSQPVVIKEDTAKDIAEKNLIAYWPFEDLIQQTVTIETERRTIERNLLKTTEVITSYKETIYGHAKQQRGVSGRCLKFNEYDTEIIRKSGETPEISPKSFTIEAWIAPQSYPWNWCPIIMQKNEDNGYYFGVDGDGRFGLHVSIGGEWYECNSKMPFPGLKTEHQWNSDARAWEYKGEGQVPPQPEPFGENPGKPVIPLLKWSHIVGTFDS